MSAKAWQGCSRLVKPFMIGTSASSLSSITSSCSIALIMIASTNLDRTFAVSLIGSPLPNWISLVDRNNAVPPNSYIPTSKETLVLVDDFWKIIANF